MKLVNYWDKYTEMHGQQNVKTCYLEYSSKEEVNMYLVFTSFHRTVLQITIFNSLILYVYRCFILSNYEF